MDNSTILFSRAAIASVLIFAAVMFYNPGLLKIRIKDFGLFLACGLLGMLGMSLCYNEAVNRLPLSLAAVLLALTPAFVIIMAAVIFKEKITVKKTVCMILALLGCILASGLLEGLDTANISGIGLVMGLASAVFYALYSIFSKLAADRGYSTYTIIFYSLLCIAVVLLPFSDKGVIVDFVKAKPAFHLMIMVGQALCTSMLPYILYTVALMYTEAGMVSILASGAEPVAAVCFGVIFYGEIPTLPTILGMAVTIAALAALCMRGKQTEEEKRGNLA